MMEKTTWREIYMEPPLVGIKIEKIKFIDILEPTHYQFFQQIKKQAEHQSLSCSNEKDDNNFVPGKSPQIQPEK